MGVVCVFGGVCVFGNEKIGWMLLNCQTGPAAHRIPYLNILRPSVTGHYFDKCILQYHSPVAFSVPVCLSTNTCMCALWCVFQRIAVKSAFGEGRDPEREQVV